MALVTVGASLMFSTVSANVLLMLAPAASVAVTLTEIVPTSPFAGVPVKVRVVASKLSQAGRALPFASVAA